MPLRGYDSLCEENQKIITSQDSGQTRVHRAYNDKRCGVSQYQIDGVVIKDGIRCDFLVMNEDDKSAYLIELKGSDLEHAIKQLETTAERLKAQLHDYKVRYRIVCSRARTHKIESSQFKKFKSAHRKKDEFICRENVIEENI